MRTAIIGTGFVAGMHAEILNGLGVEITSVVNPNQKKAQEFANRWSAINADTSTTDALNRGLDTIHICTPPVSHVDIVKECIAAGVHLFCEKPLTVNKADAKELYIQAEDKNLIHALNFNNRFYENCEKAKTLIASKEFGATHFTHGVYLQEFHALPDYYSWRYQPEVAGPMRAVTEIGSHWIDLVRYWTGLEIQAVSATFGCFQPDRILVEGMMTPEHATPNLQIDSEDAAAITFRFSNGAIGSVFLSEVSHGRGNHLSMEVSGASDSVWWNSEMPYQLHQAQKFAGVTTHTAPFGGGFMGTFQNCIAAFYEDVKTGKSAEQPRYATFKDGAINAAVCAAIFESATHESSWTAITPL